MAIFVSAIIGAIFLFFFICIATDPPVTGSPAKVRRSSINKDLLNVTIPKKRIDGLGTVSPNKHYVVAWSDPCDNKSGHYFLLERNKVICEGRMPRPNEGKVANNGNFLLCDWGLDNKLNTIFYIFSKKGNILIKHTFSANSYNNAISLNGQYAVCQLCASSSGDSETIAFFDIAQKRLIWQLVPHAGRAEKYFFDIENQIVILHYFKGLEHRYSFSGDFLDADEWDDEKVYYSSPSEMRKVIKEMWEKNGGLTDKEQEDIVKLAKSRIKRFKNSPKEASHIYRALGEMYELLENVSEALENYEKALELNTKVGVLMKYNKLKKTLNR